MHRRPILVALSLTLLAASLGACAGSARIPPPPPPAAEAPLFATDEEALAAATAAYAEFLAVSGQILQDGGSDPERLKPLVSDEVYESEAEGFRTLATQNWVAVGNSELVRLVLQQHVSGEPGDAEVIAYACVSVAGSDVVNAEGISQADPERPITVEFEVVFTSTDTGALIVDRKVIWDGISPCLPL